MKTGGLIENRLRYTKFVNPTGVIMTLPIPYSDENYSIVANNVMTYHGYNGGYWPGDFWSIVSNREVKIIAVTTQGTVEGSPRWAITVGD